MFIETSRPPEKKLQLERSSCGQKSRSSEMITWNSVAQSGVSQTTFVFALSSHIICFDPDACTNLHVVANLSEIDSLKAQLKKTSTDKAKLESDNEKILEEFEGKPFEIALRDSIGLEYLCNHIPLAAYKVKSQAQFDVFAERVRRAESVRDDIVNAATPILSALYKHGLGTSSLDAVEIFDKLRTAPAKYMENISDAAVMGASFALAQTKSLYPRIDVDSVGDGFAAGTSDERALELISEAQESAKKVAGDVATIFQE